MKKDSVDISFVILAWNCQKFIENCLSSICSSLEHSHITHEIIVVDNGSSDSTSDILNNFLQQKKLPLLVISLQKNTGTTYSRNLAFQKAKGTYICVMDSDLELRPHVMETLMENVASDSSVGLAVPKLVYPNGKLQKSTDVFPSVARKIYRYFFLKNQEAREAEEKKDIQQPEFVDYAISALWMMKADLIKKIGPLDEKIFYAPEDLDYCLRIWKAGYKIIYDPRVYAIHHTQEISRGFQVNKAFFSHIKGLIYYFHKHRYWFRAPKRNILNEQPPAHNSRRI